MITSQMDRLEDFITEARSGKKIQLDVELRKETVQQLQQTNESDDLSEQKDTVLFVGDFSEADGRKVTKIYAFSEINEKESDAKTTLFHANERLKMDYRRLKEADIEFEEKLF